MPLSSPTPPGVNDTDHSDRHRPFLNIQVHENYNGLIINLEKVEFLQDKPRLN